MTRCPCRRHRFRSPGSGRRLQMPGIQLDNAPACAPQWHAIACQWPRPRAWLARWLCPSLILCCWGRTPGCMPFQTASDWLPALCRKAHPRAEARHRAGRPAIAHLVPSEVQWFSATWTLPPCPAVPGTTCTDVRVGRSGVPATLVVCPFRVSISQTTSVPLAVTTVTTWPSGLKRRLLTRNRQEKRTTSLALCKSHMMTVPFSLPEATVLPSAANAIASNPP